VYPGLDAIADIGHDIFSWDWVFFEDTNAFYSPFYLRTSVVQFTVPKIAVN
jgi:hypothetical protein